MSLFVPQIFSPPERGVFKLCDEQEGEQKAINYLHESVANSVFPINSSYFHSDGGASPLRFCAYPNLLRAFGALGFNFDSPASIGAVKDYFSERQPYVTPPRKTIEYATALRILGEFSRSAEMANQVKTSGFPSATQFYKEGREKAVSDLAREVDPHLLPSLAQIVAQYVVGDPNTFFKTQI